MTTNQRTILSCMEHNVLTATTKAMRETAQQTLDNFREHLKPRREIRISPFESFMGKLENELP
jgi:hypothetical protein